MMIKHLINIVILLGCFPFAAYAALYKCTQSNGSVAYQGTVCAKGVSSQQELNVTHTGTGDSILVATMGESMLISLRSATRHAEQQGRMSDAAAACIVALDRSRFNAIIERILAEKLSPDERRVTDKFFNGSTGRKFASFLLSQSYSANGETPPEPPPILTEADNRNLLEFIETSAGQALGTQKLMINSNALPAVVSLILELRKSCGDK